MISTQEALQIVFSNRFVPQTQKVPLRSCIGRVLAENIVADRDFPPFNRVAMDGIAVAFEAGKTNWQIENRQYAGEPQKRLSNPENCIEVMTGAVLPAGTDTVIRYEDFIVEDKKTTLSIDYQELNRNQNVHRQGSNRILGDILIEIGTKISPAEMGVIASVGKTEVLVNHTPSVAIISTGDELVDIDQTPLLYQIRRSNSYMLAGALQECFIQPNIFHLNDDKKLLFDKIKEILTNHEVVILNGGVSEGKADFVPEILAQLGVQKLFHKVSQRPGKPFWFGKSPEGKLVFALPGNPVSTFVCLCKYVLPSLVGKPITEKVALAEKVIFKPQLTYFVPVKIFQNSAGILMAKPFEGGGSGDFANLLSCDGFVELPAEQNVFEVGEVLEMIRFR